MASGKPLEGGAILIPKKVGPPVTSKLDPPLRPIVSTNVTNVRKCKEVKYYIKQLAGYKVVHVLSVTGAIYTPFRMYEINLHVWSLRVPIYVKS